MLTEEYSRSKKARAKILRYTFREFASQNAFGERMDTQILSRLNQTQKNLAFFPAVAPFPLSSFGSNATYQENFIWLGVIIGSLMLALYTWSATKKSLARSAERRERIRSMVNVMQGLMIRRVRVEMFPSQREGNARDSMFSGFCTGCGASTVQFEFTLKTPLEIWPYHQVDIFFKVQEEESATSFYAFTASVRGAAIANNRVQVEVPLPTVLRREQKRAYFRITPSSEVISALALWPVPPEKIWLDTMSGRTLGRPMFGFRPSKVRQIILEDISAGGARLCFDEAHYEASGMRFKMGDTFVLLAVFRDKGGELEHQFWLNAQCVHLEKSTGRTEVMVGLQFYAWCETQNLTDPIVWEAPGEGKEVPPLQEWVNFYARERQQEKRMGKYT